MVCRSSSISCIAESSSFSPVLFDPCSPDNVIALTNGRGWSDHIQERAPPSLLQSTASDLSCGRVSDVWRTKVNEYGDVIASGTCAHVRVCIILYRMDDVMSRYVLPFLCPLSV